MEEKNEIKKVHILNKELETRMIYECQNIHEIKKDIKTKIIEDSICYLLFLIIFFG